MIQRFTSPFKKLYAFISDKVLTALAFLWVSRYVIAEIAAAILVVTGIALIYSPAAFIAGGALLWLIARNIEAYANVPKSK